MTVPVGGLRERLVVDSLSAMLRSSLDALGWFDTGRQHLPINLIDTPVEADQEIPLNTIAFEPGRMDDTEGELGSNLTIDDWVFYIDIFAENRAVGLHLSGDVRDILRGKMASAGRTSPILDVYDYRQDPAALLFTVQLDNVQVEPAPNTWPQPWRKNWYSVTLHLTDAYGDESD